MDRRALLTLIPAAGALAACSTGPADSSSDSSGSGSGGRFTPVSIRHAFGTTRIERRPTRVATLGWSDQDQVLALGVVPVGAVRIDYGGNAAGSTDWFDARLKQVRGQQPRRYSDKDGIPFSDVAAVRPDLILATQSGVTKADYEKLSKIAPTVAYPRTPWGTSWRDSLDLVGRALGRQAEAKRLRASLDRQLAQTRSRYPQLRGKTGAWVGLDGPTAGSPMDFYTPSDQRSVMLRELGLGTAPFVARADRARPGQFFTQISAEKASTVDADVLVWFCDPAAAEQQVRRDPLLRQVPALRRGSVYFFSDKTLQATMTNASPLSIPVALQRLVPHLAQAASRA